ncbi:MAG: response regulator [Desulfobacterales bacterium]|nr:response regulator [Desulfobacterales bacterium]MDJ0854844.1 response regulator [Desulfobacterales bacterium]MDJ0887182.1 response regulator [Desulfobacterales bacterium]MDJ0988573.1 response regulator [Desulfobacterales bacterium]
MDKVLIVDGNADFVASLKDGLDKMHQFEVLTATDGEAAIEVLSQSKVAVFVTDINTPKLDGLELLAYITQEHASTPCIVMTDYGKPWFRKRMDQQEVLYHLEKPFEIGALASAIFVGLNLRDEGMNYKGMTMASILPLIEIEQKTCRMEIKSSGKGKGYLYFDEGVLIDAHFKGLTGEKAALEISEWDRIVFKLSELPRRRTRTRVKTHLMDMAGASWMREETEVIEEESTTSPGVLLETSTTVSPQVDLESTNLVLQRHLEEFKSIKGYKAVAVVSTDGDVLAADQAAGDLDLERLTVGMSSIYSVAEETIAQAGFKSSEALTLHTKNGVVLIASSPLETLSGIRLMGITAPDGNWFYMKVQLENLFPKLLAELD